MVSLENSVKFKGGLRPILHNLFQKIEGRTLPNSFYEVSINLIPNQTVPPTLPTAKKHPKTPNPKANIIHDIHRKIFNKILINRIQQYMK